MIYPYINLFAVAVAGETADDLHANVQTRTQCHYCYLSVCTATEIAPVNA